MLTGLIGYIVLWFRFK